MRQRRFRSSYQDQVCILEQNTALVIWRKEGKPGRWRLLDGGWKVQVRDDKAEPGRGYYLRDTKAAAGQALVLD